MTTKQNDTAALTDEQLERVAGGVIAPTKWLKSFTAVKKGLASSPLGLQGNYVGVLNPDSMCWWQL